MLKALPTLFPNLLGTASSARVEFYDKFQREADEYDRDFMKKYDEDLNTTLIFVSVCFRFRASIVALIRFSAGIGRSVLCRHIRFHPRRPEKSPTGLHAVKLRTPQDHRSFLAWEPANWRRCSAPPVEWPRFHCGPCSSHPLLKFGSFPPLRVRRHVGQAVAQPLLPDGDARVRY